MKTRNLKHEQVTKILTEVAEEKDAYNLLRLFLRVSI